MNQNIQFAPILKCFRMRTKKFTEVLSIRAKYFRFQFRCTRQNIRANLLIQRKSCQNIEETVEKPLPERGPSSCLSQEAATQFERKTASKSYLLPRKQLPRPKPQPKKQRSDNKRSEIIAGFMRRRSQQPSSSRDWPAHSSLRSAPSHQGNSETWRRFPTPVARGTIFDAPDVGRKVSPRVRKGESEKAESGGSIACFFVVTEENIKNLSKLKWSKGLSLALWLYRWRALRRVSAVFIEVSRRWTWLGGVGKRNQNK